MLLPQGQIQCAQSGRGVDAAKMLGHTKLLAIVCTLAAAHALRPPHARQAPVLSAASRTRRSSAWGTAAASGGGGGGGGPASSFFNLATRGGGVAQAESPPTPIAAYYAFAGILLHKWTSGMDDARALPAALFGLAACAAAHAVVTHWSALCASCSSRWRALRGKGG